MRQSLQNVRRFEPRTDSSHSRSRNPAPRNGFQETCLQKPRMRGMLPTPHLAPLPPVQDFISLPETFSRQHFPVSVKQESAEFDASELPFAFATASSNIETVSSTCNRLREELDHAMHMRESMLTGMREDLETSLRLFKAEKEVLVKEREQAEAMKKEAERAYQIASEESRRAKAERQALERISTDISVQIAELKRIQHQVHETLENRGARVIQIKEQNQDHLQDPNQEFEEKLNLLETELTSHNHTSRELEHTLQKTLGISSSIQSQPVELKCDELDGIVLSRRKELLFSKHQELEDAKACSEEQPPLKRKMFNDGRSCLFEEMTSQKAGKKYKIPIEVILEEDAPGLFEKLQEKGLLSNLLYGDFFEEFCNCSDLEQDDFRGLEDVVKNLWGTGSRLLKLPHIRNSHIALNNRPSYCLACLVSLIEQTRSMLQRGWHVEWGWCRELHAFIFVFDKHNRIVVERPEYGYATYFFELVESLSLKWQVGRLIRVMSVPTIGRTVLLENRPLEVGQDVTIEEGNVLEDYGWTPNTGIGSLLNFCDRVVHDIKDEDNTDWRQKIGKCLMDGYDHGRIAFKCISAKLQKKLGIVEDAENDASVSINSDITGDEDVKVEHTIIT